jgi:predicted DNA-binding transcriptional regulator AlpA
MIRALDMPALQERLHVSRSTIDRWTKRTDPVARLHKLQGVGKVLVAEFEVERWMRENTYSPT